MANVIYQHNEMKIMGKSCVADILRSAGILHTFLLKSIRAVMFSDKREGLRNLERPPGGDLELMLKR